MQSPNFTFDHKEHVYTLNGKSLTGVTSVLDVIAKPALIQWAVNEADRYIRENVAYAIPGEDGGFWAIKPSVINEARYAHRKKKEDAGQKGTDVHALIEEIINNAIKGTDGCISVLVQSTNAQVEKFIAWAIENRVKFLACEQRMYSETHWLAGTCDFVCEIGGKKYVGDLKTSSGIYYPYFLQVAAYRMMLEEMGEKDFHGSIIVRCGKKGDFEVKERFDYETDKAGFLNALGLYRAINTYNIK